MSLLPWTIYALGKRAWMVVPSTTRIYERLTLHPSNTKPAFLDKTFEIHNVLASIEISVALFITPMIIHLYMATSRQSLLPFQVQSASLYYAFRFYLRFYSVSFDIQGSLLLLKLWVVGAYEISVISCFIFYFFINLILPSYPFPWGRSMADFTWFEDSICREAQDLILPYLTVSSPTQDKVCNWTVPCPILPLLSTICCRKYAPLSHSNAFTMMRPTIPCLLSLPSRSLIETSLLGVVLEFERLFGDFCFEKCPWGA